MFARFDENPAMPLEDIKETKRYGRTHGRTHRRTNNAKTVYPPKTKLGGGGGIKSIYNSVISVLTLSSTCLCIVKMTELF